MIFTVMAAISNDFFHPDAIIVNITAMAVIMAGIQCVR
jgi:hypothetical protein